MIATASYPAITWEKLPADFVLPDDPVDNIHQPALAAALTESLQISDRLPETALTPTNYGICARFNERFVVKAPDWAYIPNVTVPQAEIVRSYTPHRQGYWLRWWDEAGNLLLWGSEQVTQERQRADAERPKTEQERQRAERLLAQFRAAGIEPEV